MNDLELHIDGSGAVSIRYTALFAKRGIWKLGLNDFHNNAGSPDTSRVWLMDDPGSRERSQTCVSAFSQLFELAPSI